jgi:hypothetical protein
VANRAYVVAWAQDYTEATHLDKLERLLATTPLSASWRGFTSLVVRALDSTQSPSREWDLRGRPMSAADVVHLLRESQGADFAYEVTCLWDLWTFDIDSGRWQNTPQPLQIDCYGPEYDEGPSDDQGNFLMDMGFEHFFTGHARLLTTTSAPRTPPSHPEEVRFLTVMQSPERLREYHERTRENIQLLYRWIREAETAVPLDRFKMWSEGEENFEARVDEILAER